MSKPDNGGPAFPVVAENGLGHIADGLSKREWFAGMVLQGFCANPEFTIMEYHKIAKHAKLQADAMLAELKKGQADD